MEGQDSRDCDVIPEDLRISRQPPSSEKTDLQRTNDRMPASEAVIKKVGKSARLILCNRGVFLDSLLTNTESHRR